MLSTLATALTLDESQRLYLLKREPLFIFFSRRLIAKTYRKAPKGHPCFTPLETLKGSLKKPFTFTCTMDFYENSHMSLSRSTSRNVQHKRFLLMQTYIKKPVSLPVYTISLKVISHLKTTSLFFINNDTHIINSIHYNFS